MAGHCKARFECYTECRIPMCPWVRVISDVKPKAVVRSEDNGT